MLDTTTTERTLRISCQLPESAEQLAAHLRDQDVDVARVDGCDVHVTVGPDPRFALALADEAFDLGLADYDIVDVLSQLTNLYR